MSNENKQESEPVEFGIKFSVIPETNKDVFKKIFTGYEEGLMRSEPGGFVMPPNYCENAESIFRLKPQQGDVWLLSFPKTGTTWTAELLWLLSNDLDYAKAAQVKLGMRTLFPEISYLVPASIRAKNAAAGIPAMPLFEKASAMPSPRLIRPHLPMYLLHPTLLDTAKVVYVARNPKDVIVSYYHHHKLIKYHGCETDIDTFADYFMKDLVVGAPFFAHVLEAWNQRHHPNLHFIFYEDMKSNLKGEIEKVAKFLGKELTDDQLTKLTDHLRFDKLQQNEAVNNEGGKKMGVMNEDGRFMRKGKTGDWMNHFSAELNQRIDEWIEKNLEGTDLKFISELEHQD